MANTAKQYLYRKTNSGRSSMFRVTDDEAEEHGGTLGQMTGQGYLTRVDDEYQLTPKGERWLAPMLKE